MAGTSHMRNDDLVHALDEEQANATAAGPVTGPWGRSPIWPAADVAARTDDLKLVRSKDKLPSKRQAERNDSRLGVV